MFKKILSLLLAAAMAALLAVTASAEREYMLTETYWCRDGSVTVVARLPENAPYAAESISALLTAPGGNPFTDGKQSGAVRASGNMILSYYLLVDLSESMSGNAATVVEFAKGLVKGSDGVRVTIFGFGQSCRLCASDLASATAVGEEMSKLDYNQQYSDVCGGVIYALDYIAKNAVTGSLSQLVVMTDGGVKLGEDAAPVSEKAESVKEAITAMPDVIVHTVGGLGGTWNSTAYDAVSGGSGSDVQVSDPESAAAAAGKIAERTNSLYMFTFPTGALGSGDAESFDAELFFGLDKQGSSTALKGIQNLDLRTGGFIDTAAADDAGVGATDGEAVTAETSADTTEVPTDETAEGEASLVEDTEPAEPTEETSADSETDETAESVSESETEAPPQTQASETAAAEVQPSTADATQMSIMWICLIICGGVIITAIVILLVVKAIRKGGKKPDDPDKPVSAGAEPTGNTVLPVTPIVPAEGIPLRISFISGSSDIIETELKDQIILGSAPDCDVVCRGATVTLHNTRISLTDGEVYIEDMNSHSNTTVEGMRLAAPLRLTSGDEVTMGRVRFRVYYRTDV